MTWLRSALSLRAKITASFTLIVVGGTVVSTLIGSRIITAALLNQAQVRARQGLEVVRTTYVERLEAVRAAVARAAASDPAGLLSTRNPIETTAARLAVLKQDAGLDFLSVVEETGRVIHGDPGLPASAADGLPSGVRRALAGAASASTEVFTATMLAAEAPGLGERAHVTGVAGPNGSSSGAADITSGLVLFAAVPVQRHGRTGGVVYGGLLLNGTTEIVDRVKRLAYAGESYRGRDAGTVTIFLGDVRIATNVMTPGGQRAIGTRVSTPVAGAVLSGGRSWQGRAFVLNDWYIAAYEPVRDGERRIVGIIYTGILEAPFLAARTEVMLTFLLVCLSGLVIVFVLTYLLTRTTIRPLEEMVDATKEIAAGNLDVKVTVGSQDEIGALAASFNNMLDSLKTMRSELQEWARTLEVKVQDRTDELVAVQARMAQSEKLASVGRLAAGVAHGINNPLGGILALTMLALEDCDAKHPLRGDLETIVAQTLRCREIVKGLLDFSHQSEGRASRLNVNAIVDNTISLLERQSMFHNVQTVRHFEDDLPPVFMDPNRLQEVIINIALNAVDAMDQKGVLTVETGRDESRGRVRIGITDTGKGIPPDAKALIFEPFYTTKNVGEGTGLGLAIVHGIVTSAGGTVDVASQPGRTTFTIWLPYATEGDDDGAGDVVGGGTGQPAGRG
jgi:two-component system, NtrC family, sensor kinase